VRRFTQSAQGQQGGDCFGTRYVTDPGPDGIPGTADDGRGPLTLGSCTVDLNPSLFLTNPDNNPFEPPPTVVDSTTYSFDGPFRQHPGYAQTSTREVAAAMGLAPTEAAMAQGIHPGERVTALTYDDLAGIRYLESGLDQRASTSDDFTFNLAYPGAVSGGVFASGNAPPPGVDLLANQVAALPASGTTLFQRIGTGPIADGGAIYERDAQGNIVAQVDYWFDGPVASTSSRIVFIDLVIPPPSNPAGVPALPWSASALLMLGLAAAGAGLVARAHGARAG
jgi:hypothetical protein